MTQGSDIHTKAHRLQFLILDFTGFMASSREGGASDILCLPQNTSGTRGTQPSSSTIEPIRTSRGDIQPCVACFRERLQFHVSSNANLINTKFIQFDGISYAAKQ